MEIVIGIVVFAYLLLRAIEYTIDRRIEQYLEDDEDDEPFVP
jgi:hypothetical protein